MSQHDFDIANQGFPATRADLNNALKAAVSNSAGTSAPSTTYAYQFWYDSTNNIIKMRNGDNDAWISVATVDQTNDLVSITHTGMLDLVDDDGSASIRFQAPSTVTSTTTFTLPDGDGDSGQTLLTDGSGTLAWHAPYSNRNLFYNGAYTVWQRSTSTASITARGYHTADRWLLEYNTAGTWTQSRSTEVPSGQGFGYSLKMDCTTAQASPTYLMHAQALEGQDLQRLAKGTSNAKSVTISFWVRSNKTGNYTAELYDLDNARHISKSYTISAADTWEKKTISYAGDTSGAFGNDNNGSLIVNFWLAANLTTYGSGTLATSWAAAANANRVVSDQVNLADSTSNEWYITGVQLEEGIATPFEHRSFGDDLRRCQRYAYKIGGSRNDTFGAGQGLYQDGNEFNFGPYFPPVTLRANPSLTAYGTAPGIKINGGANTGFTPTISGPANEMQFIRLTKASHGLSSSHVANMNFASISDYIILDAEL